MSQEAIVILNSLIYTLVSLYCINKYGLKNIGTVLSLFYSFSAWCSYFYFKSPLFYTTGTGNSFHVNLESIFYLFIINTLLFLPFTKLNLSTIKRHSFVSWKQIRIILIILSIIYSVIFLFTVPGIWKQMHSTSDLNVLRAATYSGETIESNDFIIELITRISDGVKLLFLFLSFYGLVYYNGSKKIFWICLVIYILTIFATSFQMISRGIIINFIFEIILCFVLFARNISKKITKFFLKISLVSLVLLLVFFWKITKSRFGDSENNKVEEVVSFSILRYAGEAQLNFCSLLYNKTNDLAWGYANFPLFRRFLGLEYPYGNDKMVSINYLDKKMNAPSFIFYQLAGGLYTDFGKFGTLLFSIFFFIRVNMMFRNKHTIYFYKLFIVLLLSSFIAKGIYFSSFGNEAGNLSMLFTLFFYNYFLKYKKQNQLILIPTKDIILFSTKTE